MPVPTACAVGYDLALLARLEGREYSVPRRTRLSRCCPAGAAKKTKTLGWLVQPRVFLIVLAVGPDRQTG